MPHKLCPEEIVTLQVLKSKGQSNSQVARTLGVTEGAVRYHVKRQAEGATDGRSNKSFKVEKLAQVIDQEIRERREREPDRPVNIQDLYDRLVEHHDYNGSYRSVLRFVRARYPKPKIRPRRRVETPPGAQVQVDWGDFSGLDIGDGPQKLYAFVMVLSHSRRPAVIWSLRMDQLAWHHAHNEAFRRLEGIPAVARIDNLKTGVAHGAGPWGEVNEAYRSYARALRFHVDACLPRCPEHKGKVENRVRLIRRLELRKQRFESLAELQAWTDREIERLISKQICPPTGLTVLESFRQERRLLQPLPPLPKPFDLAVNRPVHKDATVRFEGRTYNVPFRLVGLEVEVRGCADSIQVFHQGGLVAEHERHTRARLVLDPAYYEGPGDDRVMAPTPLGKMGRRLQEIFEQPVAERPLDLYAALVEVAR